MALDIPLRKNNYTAKKLILQINPSIKNVKRMSSFMHALKKNILLHLQAKAN